MVPCSVGHLAVSRRQAEEKAVCGCELVQSLNPRHYFEIKKAGRWGS